MKNLLPENVGILLLPVPISIPEFRTFSRPESSSEDICRPDQNPDLDFSPYRSNPGV